MLEETTDVEDSIETEELIVPDEVVVEGMRFVHITAGSFRMGSPEHENGRQPHPNSSGSVNWT